jgi:hypothetical protein
LSRAGEKAATVRTPSARISQKALIDRVVATITLQSETGFPLYLVVGQRTQPFGAFFAHFVTDPMSQDAYEVKQVGATVGYTARKLWGLDLRVSPLRPPARRRGEGRRGAGPARDLREAVGELQVAFRRGRRLR